MSEVGWWWVGGGGGAWWRGGVVVPWSWCRGRGASPLHLLSPPLLPPLTPLKPLPISARLRGAEAAPGGNGVLHGLAQHGRHAHRHGEVGRLPAAQRVLARPHPLVVGGVVGGDPLAVDLDLQVLDGDAGVGDDQGPVVRAEVGDGRVADLAVADVAGDGEPLHAPAAVAVDVLGEGWVERDRVGVSRRWVWVVGRRAARRPRARPRGRRQAGAARPPAQPGEREQAGDRQGNPASTPPPSSPPHTPPALLSPPPPFPPPATPWAPPGRSNPSRTRGTGC